MLNWNFYCTISLKHNNKKQQHFHFYLGFQAGLPYSGFIQLQQFTNHPPQGLFMMGLAHI